MKATASKMIAPRQRGERSTGAMVRLVEALPLGTHEASPYAKCYGPGAKIATGSNLLRSAEEHARVHPNRGARAHSLISDHDPIVSHDDKVKR